MPKYNTVKETIDRFDAQAKPAFLGFWQERESLIMSSLGGLVEKTASNGPSERYPFFGAVPSLEEQKGDHTPVFDMGDYEFTVANKTYAGAMAVKRDYFSDIQRMSGALDEMVKHIAGGLARRGQLLVEQKISQVLLEEGEFASLLSPDGVTTGFFKLAGSGHFKDNVVNKLAGGAGDFTPATLQAEDDLVNELFAVHKDDTGNFVRGMAPRKRLILCDPKRVRAYSELYRAQTLGISSAAPDNILRNGGALGMDTEVLGWSFLSGKAKTFYVDTSDDIPGPKGVIWQEREPFELEMLGRGSEHDTINEQIYWKNRGRVGFYMGHPAKVILVTK